MLCNLIMTKAIPEGYHSITTHLVVNNGEGDEIRSRGRCVTTTKYIVITTSEPKQCTHIAHLHKSSILISLMSESAELTDHLEQVAISHMVDFS